MQTEKERGRIKRAENIQKRETKHPQRVKKTKKQKQDKTKHWRAEHRKEKEKLLERKRIKE